MGTLRHRQLQVVTREGRMDATDWEHSSTHLIDNEADIEISCPATYVIATSDSNEKSAHRADYKCDGTADDAQINAAITALPTNGGTIVLMEGTYDITATISITKPVKLCGVGWSTILKPSADVSVITVGNGSTAETDVEICHLQIDGNKSSLTSTSHGVYFNTSISRSSVHDCYIHDTHDTGIHMVTVNQVNIYDNLIVDVGTGSAGGGIGFNSGSYRCTVSGNTIISPNKHGIVISGGDGHCYDFTISGNYIYSSGEIGISADQDTDYVTITNNVIDTTTLDGINLESSGATITHSGIISNNVVKNAGSSGISIGGVAGTVSKNNIVSNNTIEDSANNGILAIYCDNCVISGNSSYSNAWSGIAVDTSEAITVIGNSCYLNDQHGIALDDSSECTVTGNICRNNNIDNGTYYGIGVYTSAAATTNNILTGNRCYDDQGTKTQDYGIAEAGSADYTTIVGNDVTGNKDGGITKAGANTIVRDNLGYVTENDGTSSIASGDTTKAVAHGLAATPTVINVIFAEQGTNDYGRWWISSVGATNFTVNVSADPGASNLDFWWEAKVR